MEHILFAHPVVAKIVAMVRTEDNHRVVEKIAFLEKRHQVPDLVVDLLDQPHIGGEYMFADSVARKNLGDAHFHEGVIDRMWVLTLTLMAHRRDQVILAIHVVIGRRRDIGPMRLDIGKMAAPSLALVFGLSLIHI